MEWCINDDTLNAKESGRSGGKGESVMRVNGEEGVMEGKE